MSLDLEPIKKRLAAATPGPWKWCDGNGVPEDAGQVYLYKGGELELQDPYVFDGFYSLWQHIEIEEPEGEAQEEPVISQIEYEGYIHEMTISKEDAALIAAAPTDIAALIAEVERLREQLAKRTTP
jgi:hypothetical protein